MQGIEDRKCRFICAIALSKNGETVKTFHGELEGIVGYEERGENGFGYDPLFVPDEVGLAEGGVRPNTEGHTYAELEAIEKDAISHRGKAMALLDKNLAAFLNEG